MTTILDPTRLGRRIALDVARTGGSTRSIVVGVQPPTAGYAVSLPEFEQRYEVGPLFYRPVARAVRDYVTNQQAVLAQPGHYLGAWLDGDVLYLDVSQVVPERAVALRLGRERQQRAIYDLARHEEIAVS